MMIEKASEPDEENGRLVPMSNDIAEDDETRGRNKRIREYLKNTLV